jgi:hypothetical protein
MINVPVGVLVLVFSLGIAAGTVIGWYLKQNGEN